MFSDTGRQMPETECCNQQLSPELLQKFSCGTDLNGMGNLDEDTSAAANPQAGQSAPPVTAEATANSGQGHSETEGRAGRDSTEKIN